MLRRCNRLENIERERASENWSYLESIGIQKRKLPYGLSRSCPLLAFFQALGISEKQLGKMLLLNPRLISYSELKLTQITDFLTIIGLNKEWLITKTLAKNPFLLGYSVEKRLWPTTEFLKWIGLDELSLQRVVCYFPEVFCRDVDRVLRPNLAFLKRCGFDNKQIANFVAGYPPALIKSVSKSLEPKMRFLVEEMGRDISEIANYLEFFRHGKNKSLEAKSFEVKKYTMQFK
ncbi:hypothetical protein ZIOFF_043170 [Zingiber officinale]|uniref:Uncharacterized protein n=1 Tax=Zingiber officinale TaxID=94328 RepID=A0A8J5FYR4_ZINOF|nr:hypothetical protein ZIOFF_043170 [Zingiber officinale]